jgi:VWFA-related protein
MTFGRLSTEFSVAIALASLPFTMAQTANPATPSPPSFSAHSTVVLVPALVRTKSGELLFTLTANDFAITDDGVEQKVALEQDTDSEPLALVIAVETCGSGAKHLDEYRHLTTSIESVVGGVPHMIAVVGFGKKPELVQNFTSDMNVVGDAIRELNPSHGEAATLDTLVFSVDLLRTQEPEYRRAILLISETLDRGSHVKLDDALQAISDTNTAIYSLAFSSPKADMHHYAQDELPTESTGGGTLTNPNPQHPGGCMAKDPNADPGTSQDKLSQTYDCLGQLVPPLALIKMAVIGASEGLHRNAPETVAHLTGGEYFPFRNSHDLEKNLLAISNHIPNRYVLSFQPRSPHPGLHLIGVRLKEHPNLVVTARRSYWADNETMNELGATPRP